MEEEFTQAYEDNSWGSAETRSGAGSEILWTGSIRYHLPLWMQRYCIQSVLDVPCGDFNWMRMVIDHLRIDKYRGIDIVKKVIDLNTKRYQTDHVCFEHGDFLEMNLPKSDLIICRDSWVHFSHLDCLRSWKLFKESGSKYVMLTHFPQVIENIDRPTGAQWTPVNLTLPPFKITWFQEAIFDHQTSFGPKLLVAINLKTLAADEEARKEVEKVREPAEQSTEQKEDKSGDIPLFLRKK